ncbi:MAG: YggS family pyridoxal phosphate-dependent enzyme [Nitrospirae bacterium]|nr:YggS family pyridoxal phosphate-dependent enzyme [Nitrospirota bacterium]
MAGIIENVSSILRRISYSAGRSGRSPEDVSLIAVTKGVSIERIIEAVDAGIRAFGENRVQEAMEKISNLESRICHAELVSASDSRIQWHMIGHLQKNKAKQAIGLFELIHSVDSIELMELINKYSERAGKVQRVLIEVKLSPEETKHGIKKEQIENLLEKAGMMKSIKVEGLMTMPSYSDNPEDSRPYYSLLKRLADGYALKELSMGMTNDFEVAVEEGATMVRIGTGIFGERKIEYGKNLS